MIYSNDMLSSEERKFDFGSIHQVSMGEHGRGRKLLALTCPENTVVREGMNPELTIGLTKSGKPRIFQRQDDEIYLLLSAEGEYTRRGCGVIRVLTAEAENFEVLASGNGADGDAGRIGYWDCKLMHARGNGIVAVQPSGRNYGIEPILYIVKDGKVYNCEPAMLEECCEQLGLEEPYVLKGDGHGDYNWSDWSWV